jgi:hypothetical protein|nr:MAG TPA: hypothetical protein [Caudoviricetes sp.]
MKIKRKEHKVIKKYFTDNCISIRQWAKKHDLSERTTYMVINGQVVGSKNFAVSRKVFEALLSEGIIKELPSALKSEQEESRAS